MEKDYKNPLGFEKTSTLLRRFALPSIISMLVSSLYNIVDQIFIGWGVGPIGNGATNVAFPFTSIMLAISLTIGVGAAARFSLELGRGNKEEASKTVGVATVWGAIFGVLCFIVYESFTTPMLKAFGATPTILPYALDYVRVTAIGMPFLIVSNSISNLIHADGKPRYSMTVMMAGAILNTILDPIFIFVLDMGIAGAAWATVISQILSFTICIFYIPRFKCVTITRDTFRPSIKTTLKTASLGLSNGLNQVAICLVQIVMNNSIVYYGAMTAYGTDIPLSAVGVVMKVNAILMSVFIGIQQGTRPIMGYNYGAKKYSRVKETYRLGIIVDLLIGLIGFVAFEFFPEYVLLLFGRDSDPLYMEFAVKFMRIFLCTMVVNGVQFLSANFFSAIGKPWRGVILSMSRQCFLFIPLMLIIPRVTNLGLMGIIISGPIADVIAVTLSVIFVYFEFRNMKRQETECKNA